MNVMHNQETTRPVEAGYKAFDAVIFDMDGLLLDSEKIALTAFKATCASFDMEDLPDLFRQLIGTNAQMGRRILEEGLGGKVDVEAFSTKWGETYRAATESGPIPLKEGAGTLLEHLSTLRLPMAVATSSPTRSAQVKLKNSGIFHYFRHIIGGEQVARSKPDPEIYLKASSILSSSPARCLAFEDSANGVKSAVAAGMTVVQIPDLVPPDASLLELGHIVLESLTHAIGFDFSRKA